MAAFLLLRQSWIVVTETILLSKPEIFTLFPFIEKVCQPLSLTIAEEAFRFFVLSDFSSRKDFVTLWVLTLLMWTIFEVFIEFVTILLLFYVLFFWLRGMWDLSSPCIGRRSLNHWTTREVPSSYSLVNHMVNKEKAGSGSTAVPCCLRGMMLSCPGLGYRFLPHSCGELESASLPLESGLALALTVTNRLWQKWHCVTLKTEFKEIFDFCLILWMLLPPLEKPNGGNVMFPQEREVPVLQALLPRC